MIPSNQLGSWLKSIISTKVPWDIKLSPDWLFLLKVITKPVSVLMQFFTMDRYLGSKIWSVWIVPGKTTNPKGKTGSLFVFDEVNDWLRYLFAVFVTHY